MRRPFPVPVLDCRCGDKVVRRPLHNQAVFTNASNLTHGAYQCLAITATSRVPPGLMVRDWSRILGMLGVLGYDMTLPESVLYADCECVDYLLDFIGDPLCSALSLYGASLCHSAGRALCRHCLATGHFMLFAAYLLADEGRSQWATALTLIRVTECLGCATYDALRSSDGQACECASNAWKWCRGQICAARASAVVQCARTLAGLYDPYGPRYLANIVGEFRPDKVADTAHHSGARTLFELTIVAYTPHSELPAALGMNDWAVGLERGFGMGNNRRVAPPPSLSTEIVQATEEIRGNAGARAGVEPSAYLPYIRRRLIDGFWVATAAAAFPASAPSSPLSLAAVTTAAVPDVVLRSVGTFDKYAAARARLEDRRFDASSFAENVTWAGVSALDAPWLTQLCRTCFVSVMSTDHLGRPRVPSLPELVGSAADGVSAYSNSWVLLLFLDDGDDAQQLLRYTEMGHNQGYIPPETDASYCEGVGVDVAVVDGDPADPATAAHRYGLGLTIALASASYGVKRVATPCVEVAAFYRAVLWSRWYGCGGRDAHVVSAGWSYRRRPEPRQQLPLSAAPTFPPLIGQGLRPVAQRLITTHLVAWGNRLPSSH
jgi:hypothetical protein